MSDMVNLCRFYMEPHVNRGKCRHPFLHTVFAKRRFGIELFQRYPDLMQQKKIRNCEVVNGDPFGVDQEMPHGHHRGSLAAVISTDKYSFLGCEINSHRLQFSEILNLHKRDAHTFRLSTIRSLRMFGV